MFVCIHVCVCARHTSGEWHFSFCSSLMASLAGLLRWKPRCHGNAACLCELEIFHSLSPPLSLAFCHTLSPSLSSFPFPVPLSLSVSSSLILFSTCLPPKTRQGSSWRLRRGVHVHERARDRLTREKEEEGESESTKKKRSGSGIFYVQ